MRTIGISIFDYPGVLKSSIYGVLDLFEIANRFVESPLFEVKVIRALQLSESKGSKVLFVPPCLDEQIVPAKNEVAEGLKHWSDSGVIIAATCASVFWVAEAGLLKNRSATTHWRLHDRLADEYPDIVAVDRRNMVVDQGSVISAAGLYAFQDLTLHLIARFASFNVARQVADFALLDFKGRQQCYYQRFSPEVNHGDSKVLAVQRYCEQASLNNLSVSNLADFACVSERTLSRRFQTALKLSPGEYLQQLRVEKSKWQLESNDISLQQIAETVGYGDLSNFSKAFKRITGISPAEYRSRVASIEELQPS